MRSDCDWGGQGGPFEVGRLEKAVLWEAETWMTRESARKELNQTVPGRGDSKDKPTLQKEGQSGAGGRRVRGRDVGVIGATEVSLDKTSQALCATRRGVGFIQRAMESH